MQNFSYYLILVFILIVLIFSIFKKNNAYDSFINGSKDAMKSGIVILPYLLVMYVAVNVFKASGILDDLINTKNIPNELLIQGIFRPASSHASLSVMVSIIDKYGVDSKPGFISSILQGGSDTTIYVMGLYFGYIGIKKTRHSYIVGMISDIICFIICIILFFLI